MVGPLRWTPRRIDGVDRCQGRCVADGGGSVLAGGRDAGDVAENLWDRLEESVAIGRT